MIYNLKDLYENPSKYSEFIYEEGYKIYKITNLINNKSYIGDTSISIAYRHFDAWYGGHYNLYLNKVNIHLYNSMNKYGLDNFTLEILPNNETFTEEYYIELFDSFFNGFNRNPNGKFKGSISKRIVIELDNIFKYVKPIELQYYLDKGWIRSGLTKNYLWLINEVTMELKRVHKDNLDLLHKYSLEGYVKKGMFTNYKSIYKNGTYSKVHQSKLDEFLLDGWLLKSPNKGKFYVTNGSNDILISPFDELEYNELGYYKGTSNHVFNDSTFQSIQGRKGAIKMNKIHKERGSNFYDSKVQKSNNSKRNINSITKTLNYLRSNNIIINEINYNENRPKYLGCIKYDKAIMKFPELFIN
jgi:hypothetical protein